MYAPSTLPAPYAQHTLSSLAWRERTSDVDNEGGGNGGACDGGKEEATLTMRGEGTEKQH